MPLIQPNKTMKNQFIKLSCPCNLLEEIQQYCEAFQVEKIEDFFLQSARYVLTHDKDWMRSKK